LTGAAGAAAATSLGSLAGCFPKIGGEWPDASAQVISTCGCSTPDGGGATSNENQPAPVAGTSTVVTIRRDDSVDATGQSVEQPYLDVVAGMVDAVLSALAGGAANPWSVILPEAGPCTRIGLKVNCLNPSFPTSPAIVRAMIKSLVTHLQVCPGNILVWDRRGDELVTGRYTDEHLQGARLIGTVKDLKDLHGPGYSHEFFGTFQGATPLLSRILTEQTDVTINCPVLKKHNQSGITGALKNIYGIINIPGNYHTDADKGTDLQTALPALYNIPAIRRSIKLTIVDALKAVIIGDTNSNTDAVPKRIFGSLDPVAVDCYALDLVNQLRASRSQKPVLSELVRWLDNAQALGLGTKSYNLVTLPGSDDADAGAGDATEI
jgi:uncharacterized protein (DUF362 family)